MASASHRPRRSACPAQVSTPSPASTGAPAPQGITPPAASPTSSAGRLIPVTAWNDFHPWPPVGGLRHLIFHAKQNGFEQVVRRAGRRVLIDETAFFNWVNQQGVSA